MTTPFAWVIRGPAALGRAVRARREAVDLTQQRLAELGATNRYAVMRIEDGTATKALHTVFDVLFALDLELTVRAKSGDNLDLELGRDPDDANRLRAPE